MMTGLRSRSASQSRQSSPEEVAGLVEEDAGSGASTPESALEGPPTLITIHLHCPLTKKPTTVWLSPTESIKKLRRFAQKAFGAKSVRLVIRGREEELDTDESVAKAGLVEGESVHVVPKMGTGQARAKLTRVESEEEVSEKSRSAFNADLKDLAVAYVAVNQKALARASEARRAAAEEMRAETREAMARARADAAGSTPEKAAAVEAERGRMKEKVEAVQRQRSLSARRAVISAPAAEPDSLAPGLAAAEAGSGAADAPTPEAGKDAGCEKCGRKAALGEHQRCRCSRVFCPKHNGPERHDCSFDYKAAARTALSKANPRLRDRKHDDVNL